jgi:hypothetical protein
LIEVIESWWPEASIVCGTFVNGGVMQNDSGSGSKTIAEASALPVSTFVGGNTTVAAGHHRPANHAPVAVED